MKATRLTPKAQRKIAKAQRFAANKDSKGNSKYAVKVRARRKLAKKLGFSPDTPMPLLLLNM